LTDEQVVLLADIASTGCNGAESANIRIGDSIVYEVEAVPEYFENVSGFPESDGRDQEIERQLKDLGNEIAAKYPRTLTQFCQGLPHLKINEMARKLNVDLIVLSTHKRSCTPT
jgi:nucleotide-binding universal stress UspA family protein